MLTNFRFYAYAAVVCQLLTGLLHSLSFLNNPEPSNEQEKQMLDLMMNYKMDMGFGMMRTMYSLFNSLSACMTLICFLGGLVNLFLLRSMVASPVIKGVMGINAFIFGVGTVIMILFAFMPPIVCLGLIFLFSFLSFLLAPKGVKEQ
ncbi:MAG: hypothetical protein IPL25_13520 [Saprospiraceae bacterium]|nr:hypothetical protein [Candidatus Vicinibacter affinis]